MACWSISFQTILIKCTAIPILMPVGFPVKFVALQSIWQFTAMEIYLVGQFWKTFKHGGCGVHVFVCVCVAHGEKNMLPLYSLGD